MIVKIPVRPHVKKYLEKKLPGSYRLSEKDQIGKFLIHLLRRPHSNQWLGRFQSSYTETFEVDISDRLIFNFGARNLNPRTILDFNSYIDSLFKEALYTEIDLIAEYNLVPVRTAIYQFIHKYGMEVDVHCTYFRLRKAYYRYVKEKNGLQSA